MGYVPPALGSSINLHKPATLPFTKASFSSAAERACPLARSETCFAGTIPFLGSRATTRATLPGSIFVATSVRTTETTRTVGCTPTSLDSITINTLSGKTYSIAVKPRITRHRSLRIAKIPLKTNNRKTYSGYISKSLARRCTGGSPSSPRVAGIAIPQRGAHAIAPKDQQREDSWKEVSKHTHDSSLA